MRKHRKRRIRRAKAAARVTAKATARDTVKSKEDRISDLPDCMIHHILSFMPSTKEAIQTSILSKRWLHQWTHVPVLIFDDSKDISPKNFLDFVDNTLSRHDCSKVKKFHLKYDSIMYKDPQLDSKILFATRKHVEELYLSCYWQVLPQFLFNTASSLVKLTAFPSSFKPDRKVNWGCLTALTLDDCELNDQAVQHILSGSPLLESFELINYHKFDKLVIASKSLKNLVLRLRHECWSAKISAIEISCPNLVELSLDGVKVEGDANLFGKAFANFLSTSTLLKSLELIGIVLPLPHEIVIASKSLKRLVIRLNYNISNLHLSCPQLELLVLYGWFHLKTSKLHDLPSSLCATFDFHYFEELYDDYDQSSISVVQDILQQLHHVKQVTIGNLFINILSTFGVEYPFSSVLNVKSLTLNFPNLINHYSGIARLLRHAPELEELVINIPIYDQAKLELGDFGENFWNPDATVFNCLVTHLKTIKIIDVWNNHYVLKFMISFVQFLLKNARVLEKMIVITKGSKSASKRISNKLFHLQRCSKDAIVELVTLKPKMFETCHYIYTNK